MKALLELPDGLYENLMGHLLPRERPGEQAAFLFALCARSDHKAHFTVIEARKLRPRDFAAQEGTYIELEDGTRAALIKRAHDLGASLIEIHSHLGCWPAAFSPSDRSGLRETVPHMWWRLKGRPYLALAVTRTGFDALIWLDSPRVPRALDALLAGVRTLTPTNRSLTGWT